MDPEGGPSIECLLAEDNPGDVQLIREAIASVSLPIHLHVVHDGDETLAFLQQRGAYVNVPRPDLIVLDLSLPKRRGEEVLAALKGDAGLQTIPVFISLEFAEERFLVRHLGLHPALYLLKPIDARQIARALRHDSLRERVNEALAAVRETMARANEVLDQTRKVVQKAQEFRQYRRAWAERKAELRRLRGDSPAPLSPAGETPISSVLPVVDFLQLADFMREELQKFFSVVRRGEDRDAILQVVKELQWVLSHCEPLVSNPAQRNSLPEEQRWGFLLLLSSVQSAREALTVFTTLAN